MVICSAVLIALGVGLTIYGFHLNNSVEAQLNALFESGNVDPGTVWIIAGLIALAVGIVLLILGLVKKPGGSSGGAASVHEVKHDTRICPHCKKTLKGSPTFCVYCGKPLSGYAPAKGKTCPRCGRVLPVGTTVCTYCGPEEKENICLFCESILPEGVMYCPACGKDVSTRPVPPPVPGPVPIPRPDPRPAPPPVPRSDNLWGTPKDSDL